MRPSSGVNVVRRGAIAAGVAALVLAASVAAAEVIDRILAVVSGEVITLSDVRAVQRFGLVPADVSDDPVDAALQRLIDRRLMLAEVDRYAPPEPPQAAVDAAVTALEGKYKDALAFEIALNQTSMSREALRGYVRDSLRLDAYMEQRFASIVQLSDDEAARYYREHASEFVVDGQLRLFDEIREEARARAVEARRAASIREWVDGLRRRASLLLLYLPGRGSE